MHHTNIIVFVLVCIGLINAQQWSTVLYESGKYVVQSGQNTSGVAWGYFTDEIAVNGWGTLFIQSNEAYESSIQMYAAGYLEGVLTQVRMGYYRTNFMANQFGGPQNTPPPQDLIQFVTENFAWTRKTADAEEDKSVYWWHVSRILDQFDGLLDGYNNASSTPMSFEDLLLINLSGDLDDLQSVYPTENEKDWTDFSLAELESKLAKRGRCSSIVKVTASLSDLMIAHTTWGNYWTMQRIWKVYNFNIQNSNSTGMSFSGYPGILLSFDDYFIMKDTNLVITETTNSVINVSLYENNVPVQSVMYWIRTVIANRMATTGKEWVDIFSLYNSGTYNNQWIVLDYKLFSPGKAIVNNTLWILEQMPGAVFIEDVSHILQYGYWPSYNRPYFTEVYNAMGYAFYTSKYGDIYSYELNPRANIFRRDQGQVETLEDLLQLMQSNNYQTDPLSDGYAGSAISSRFDLKGGPSAPPEANWFAYGTHGGLDSKVTNAAMAVNSQAMVINGPTHQNPSMCPPFSWASWPNISHVGVPEVFNFTWVAV